MKISNLACAALLAASLSHPALAQNGHTALPEVSAPAEMHTQWIVRGAAGLDALLLIGAASGDILQADYHPEAIAYWRERLSPEGLAALDTLDQALRVDLQRLTGPGLAYAFSAGPVATLQDVIASAEDPDRYLRPTLTASARWNADRYDQARQLFPVVATALRALEEAGFSDWYAQTTQSLIDDAVAANQAAVAPFDIIPEQARLLGRDLEREIELIIVRFAAPYGIRVIGQRFVAYHGWDAATQLRVAAHEIFHPPFDLEDATLRAALTELDADEWMISIVENHNPAFGYNSFRGVVNEDSTQALDQIVAERLGFARDPALRWQHSDDGMHMLAAALYHAMKEDGFDQRGGRYHDWLVSALDRGLLTPEEVRRRAAEIVGQAAVDKWYELAG